MTTKYNIFDWQYQLCEDYISFQKKSDKCAASTQRSIKASLYNFFDFLNKHNIEKIIDVTASDLENWNTGLTHIKSNTRNEYVSKLRNFFEYLSEKNLASSTLPMALMCRRIPVTTVIETLSDKHLETIDKYRLHATTAIEFRTIAIVFLGLKMGMRGCDILKLKITDISWKNGTISFEQEKTGVFIQLPMPIEVGNVIYQYITQYRPHDSKSEQVFVSHQPPYNELKQHKVLTKSLKRIFLNEDINMPKGFHITRKTFASKMLCSGSAVEVIATALGHSSLHSIAPYLSTDDKSLQLCGIGCKGIEYKGAYNL